MKQLTQFAVSLTGHYIEDPVPNHPRFQKIHALPVSTTSVWDELKRQQSEGTIRNCPSLDLIEREQGVAEGQEEEGKEFLIVGYSILEKDLHMAKTPKNMPQARYVGTFEPDEDAAYKVGWGIGHASYLLVVVPCGGNIERAKPYCLLNPEEGLCKPYLTSLDHVFFRHEFRVNAKSQLARRTAWAAAIREAATVEDEVQNDDAEEGGSASSTG
jgi:hypothetical protein